MEITYKLTHEQQIRERALGIAAILEGQLPSAFADGVTPNGRPETPDEAAVWNAGVRKLEDATIARVIRHADRFAEWISENPHLSDADLQSLATRE